MFSRKTAADVKQIKIVAQGCGKIEDFASNLDAPAKDGRIPTTRPGMEADADNINAQLASQTKQMWSFGHRIASKLHAQRALRLFCIAADANDHSGVGKQLLDLVQLVLVVERHGVDTHCWCIADVARRFGGIGKDDVRRIDSQRKHLVDFGPGCTIESGSQRRQDFQYGQAVVAFYSWK